MYRVTMGRTTIHKTRVQRASAVVAVVLLLVTTWACSGGDGGGASPPASLATCETEGYLDLPADQVLTHASPRPFDPWILFETGAHLRGVNTYQRRTYPSWDDGWNGDGPVGPPYTLSDFTDLRATGANVVDLSFPGLIDEVAPYALCDSIQSALDARLEQLAAADLFAILSFRTGPGRNEFSIIGPDKWRLASIWETPADQDAWIAMWRYTARRYRNHPTVIAYDLMVEPNANDMLGPIWEPEPFFERYGGTVSDWNLLADRIIAAIREEDPQTPIIVGSDGYSGVTWLPYLELQPAERLVFSVHQYDPHEYVGKEQVSADCSQERYPGEPCSVAEFRTYLSPIADVIAMGIPVVVNEFGGIRYREGMAAYLDAQMTVFEELGVGYLAWEWGSEFELALTNDHFNIRHGTQKDQHQVAAENPLLDTFVQRWSANSDYPSTMP